VQQVVRLGCPGWESTGRALGERLESTGKQRAWEVLAGVWGCSAGIVNRQESVARGGHIPKQCGRSSNINNKNNKYKYPKAMRPQLKYSP